MKRIYSLIIVLSFIFGLTVSAHAALIDRGGGLIYDTDLDITWLSNANLAATNTFGVEGIVGPDRGNECGLMQWYTAESWIAAMNAANYLGFSDWRLPTTPGTIIGFTSEGEMGHLFYELGGVAGQYLTVTHNSNYNLFTNISPYYYYWFGTDYAPASGNASWVFNFYAGFQYAYPHYENMAVWPVRDGGVATRWARSMSFPIIFTSVIKKSSGESQFQEFSDDFTRQLQKKC